MTQKAAGEKVAKAGGRLAAIKLLEQLQAAPCGNSRALAPSEALELSKLAAERKDRV